MNFTDEIRPGKTHLTSADKKMLLWTLAVVWVLALIVLASALEKVPSCNEDEVVTYEGDFPAPFDKCVPVDDLLENHR